jgi:hypothetical protein
MEITDEQFNELKGVVDRITTRIPEDLAGYIWDMFNHLRKENEPQPCMCPSSVSHWVRAINFLRDYVNNR